MKIILKIVCKDLLANRKRTLRTLVCVILSVSIISIVLGISDSLLVGVDFEGDLTNESATKWICGSFVTVSCFMSCFTIYTAFSISSQERIKSYGFLTSIGMSAFQKTLLVLIEAMIYGVVGVLCGTLLGFGISSLFYNSISDMILLEEGVSIGRFVLYGYSVFLSLLLGFFTVIFASFIPVLRMRKLSVTKIIKDNNQINISLKQTRFSLIAEKFFGRLGLLAGQNYDNNKGKYRSLSLALSGGTIFYITIYSFFKYPIWYAIDRGRGSESVEDIGLYLLYTSQVLAAFFVFVFLFCAFGSIRQNMEQRKREFAMYKSMGMQNSELSKMMSIESMFFAWYSVCFGLVGSLIGDYAVCSFYRLVGPSELKFHYPFFVFFAFVLLDVAIGLLFALYSIHKVSNVNIIETIRNN